MSEDYDDEYYHAKIKKKSSSLKQKTVGLVKKESYTLYALDGRGLIYANSKQELLDKLEDEIKYARQEKIEVDKLVKFLEKQLEQLEESNG